MKIAYVRVSTQEQNLDRQLELLKPYEIEKVFQEKQSGKDLSREKLNELLEFVREGDEVYVESWSRLSRTVSDLLKIFEMFDRKKVRLYSVKEQYDTSSPTGKLMVNIIADSISLNVKTCLKDSVRVSPVLSRRVYIVAENQRSMMRMC